MVRHFRELRVYREAFDAAMRIFELSKAWPVEERYSLTDQIRRSSRSVCEQVAEAWRKRRYSAHFRSKLTDADSEVAETQSWLEFALRCGYLAQTTFDELDATYERVSGGLVTMMAHAEQWCTSHNEMRENMAEYYIPSPPPHPAAPIHTLSASPTPSAAAPHPPSAPAPHTPSAAAPHTPSAPAPHTPSAPASHTHTLSHPSAPQRGGSR